METGLSENLFPSGGTAMNWRSNGTYWTLNFANGFVYPFYGTDYSSVTVSTEGLLKFSEFISAGDGSNSTEKLLANRLIAPLWDNLRTNGTGDNIFVDQSVPGQVTIRWDATNEADGTDVQVATTLYGDGRIQFHYGPGNTGLSPTIGISSGGGKSYLLSRYDGQAALAQVESVEFALTPGLTYADMGAYEFRGDSSDTLPPRVLSTNPAAVEASGFLVDPALQVR